MDSQRAWVTLLTRSSYLPGVITLAYSLSTHKTIYPLIVLTTPSLPSTSLRALELESHHNPLLHIHPISPLLLPPPSPQNLDSTATTTTSSSSSSASVASRFEDTWTKLRAFSLTHLHTAVFLDADITVYRNMDELFSIPLPADDWIAANHACVCNLDHDAWAPASWTRSACAWTPLTHPTALATATPVLPSAHPSKDTHALLNSGLFIYRPSPALYTSLLEYYNTNTALLRTFQFPDQDFLAHFFRGKWMPLPWMYNALKTMENWHPGMWRDGEVRGLHYIVDKPWGRRVAGDGVAGHLGRDGKVHGWWWGVWGMWRGERVRGGREAEGRGEGGEEGKELVKLVEELVAPELDAEGERRQIEENRERGLPVPVPL
ncbi:MAG: hypothetical protein Q9219_002694 [cf. Caloplaca sp. 3 TL-2023]